MIIKFDQTPEEYFRLSRLCFGRGELDRALLYGEKALRGKSSAEYKVSVAEILVAMGRYAAALDVALDALCYSRGMRAEIFDVLARASGELGHFYESLHYIAKRAQYEGDEDTLDAMDEVMQELGSEPEKDSPGLFVVGKEPPPPASDPTITMRANFALSHGEYDEALRIASEAEAGSEEYLGARMVCLRAYIKKKDAEKALATAEELIGLDPKNGFVLYVLIDRFKKKEYLPLLSGVEDGGSELYYAILTASAAFDAALAARLAEKLVVENPYVPGAYFVAAAATLNEGNKAKSEDVLKRLFYLYPTYPQRVILKGWRRLGKCGVGFSGRMPEEVVRILERYVKKHSGTTEAFVTSVLTDEDFRASLLLVLEEGGRRINELICARLGEAENAQVDAFFAKTLLRYDVDLVLKRDIFAKLYRHRDKGRLYVAQSVVPIRVSLAKSASFKAYPAALQEAYAEVFSFLLCMTDIDCEKRLRLLADRLAGLEDADALSAGAFCGAMVYRLLSDGVIPLGAESSTAEESCEFLLSFIFGYQRMKLSRVKLLALMIAD